MDYINKVHIGNTDYDINTKATSSTLGLIKPDDSTLKVDSNGVMKVNQVYGSLAEVQAAITAGTIAEDAIVYINNDSSLENGGHIIKNSAGTAMANEPALKFVNLNVADDSTNSATVITGLAISADDTNELIVIQ